MKFQRDDVFTGLFVLIGAVLTIVVLLVLLGYNIFEQRNEYYVRMKELADVKKGTLIKLKNYTVGEVQKVIPIYGSSIYFKAKVEIDSDLLVYRGTKINIAKQNVIGDTVIEIFPSAKKKYQLREGDTLFATNIVNLNQMVAQISGLVSDVSQMVSVFGKLAGGSKKDLRQLFANLNTSILKINRVLDNSEDNLYEIMKNIQKTSVTLEEFSREVRENPLRLMTKGSGGSTSSASGLP